MNRLIKTGGVGSGAFGDGASGGVSEGSGGVLDPCAPQLYKPPGYSGPGTYYHYPCWKYKYPLPTWYELGMRSTPGP